jgi:hypothetical protein
MEDRFFPSIQKKKGFISKLSYGFDVGYFC